MTTFAFVHGGGQGSWIWDATIAAIDRQSDGAAHCVALDAPGCGTKRGGDTAAMTYAQMVAEFVADLAAIDRNGIVLVGHSQAGMVLPLVAEARPDLLCKLAYVTCSAPPSGMTTIEQMGSALHGERDHQVGWPLDPATSTIEQRYRAMFCNDMTMSEADTFLSKLGQDSWPAACYAERGWRYDHLGAIPAVYIQCLRDMSLPPVWQERFAETLRADETVRIDAGHQVMNTRPQALAEVLLAAART